MFEALPIVVSNIFYAYCRNSVAGRKVFKELFKLYLNILPLIFAQFTEFKLFQFTFSLWINFIDPREGRLLLNNSDWINGYLKECHAESAVEINPLVPHICTD